MARSLQQSYQGVQLADWIIREYMFDPVRSLSTVWLVTFPALLELQRKEKWPALFIVADPCLLGRLV